MQEPKLDAARLHRIRESVAYFRKVATWHQLTDCERDRELLLAKLDELVNAVKRHHDQHGDDRCWLDDEELYLAFGLLPGDRRVGSKEEMLANCKRFVERRCEEGGPWKSYAALEAENDELRKKVEFVEAALNKASPKFP